MNMRIKPSFSSPYCLCNIYYYSLNNIKAVLIKKKYTAYVHDSSNCKFLDWNSNWKQWRGSTRRAETMHWRFRPARTIWIRLDPRGLVSWFLCQALCVSQFFERLLKIFPMENRIFFRLCFSDLSAHPEVCAFFFRLFFSTSHTRSTRV